MIPSSKNWKRETSGLLIVVLILGLLWTETWAQMTEVNMGIAFVNARVAPLWVADEVAKVVPKAASLKFEDVADPNIIEKLEKNGFIDSLYK